MTKEDFLKKDLALLNASAALQNMAYLRTIIDTQAFIVSELTKRSKSDISKELANLVADNHNNILNETKTNIPDISIIQKWN